MLVQAIVHRPCLFIVACFFLARRHASLESFANDVRHWDVCLPLLEHIIFYVCMVISHNVSWVVSPHVAQLCNAVASETLTPVAHRLSQALDELAEAAAAALPHESAALPDLPPYYDPSFWVRASPRPPCL